MQNFSPEQNRSQLIVLLSIIFILSGSTSSIGSTLGYLALFLVASLGPMGAVTTFFLLWFGSVANPYIFQTYENSTLRYFLIFFLIFITIINRIKQNQFEKFDQIFVIFLIVGVIHSLIFSYYPLISILKLILWFGVLSTLFYAFLNLTNSNVNVLEGAIYKALIMILVISTPLLIFKDYGFARNDFGFQGILNHPQAYGVFLAIVGSILINKALLKSNLSGVYFLLYLLTMVQSFFTRSRLSLVTLIIVTILVVFKTKKDSMYHTKRLIKNKLLILILFFFVAFNFNSTINFMLKQSGSENIVEALKISRLKLIEPMLENITENPIFGIGFGVSSSYKNFTYENDPNIGIPYRTYNEKGLVFLQIIEEMGILIGIISLLIMLKIFINFWNYDLLGLSVITSVFLINLGESIFFSSGGIGMICIILFALNLYKLKFINAGK